MVKPSLEGSSVGLTKVKAVEELKSAVDYALKFDNTILIEEWLAGDELTVPVLGGEVLPAVRIVPEGEFMIMMRNIFQTTLNIFALLAFS